MPVNGNSDIRIRGTTQAGSGSFIVHRVEIADGIEIRRLPAFI